MQEATKQVSKWGAWPCGCPRRSSSRLGLKSGDEINIVDVVERTLVVQKEDRRKAAPARLGSRNWTLPSDYKFDRDEANER